MKRSEPFSSTIAVVAVIASGAVAGLMYGVSLAAYADGNLPKEAWVRQQQAKDKVYGRVMPPVSVSTAVSLTGAAVLSRGRARRWFAAGALFAVTSNMLTVGKEVPLNKVIVSWDPESAPPNWTDVRAQWYSNHILRAVPAALSFGCAVLGLAQRGNQG